MLEAKPNSEGVASLITLEHFQEMIRFEEFATTVEAPPELLEGLKVDKVTLGE